LALASTPEFGIFLAQLFYGYPRFGKLLLESGNLVLKTNNVLPQAVNQRQQLALVP